MASGKILVVDDSALMRRLLTTVLTEAGYTVEVARNGKEGVAKLLEVQPDAVTLDINMPEMDGLTALSLMMAARPTPVVMVSSLTEQGALATFEALALGAVDYITKPGGTISLSIEAVSAELLDKVRAALRARPRVTTAAKGTTPARPAAISSRPTAERAAGPQRGSPSARAQDAPVTPRELPVPTAAESAGHVPGELAGVVLIGVSTGGPRTLEDVLPELPADFPWPVLVAQHMPANFTGPFAERMDRLCPLAVREVAQPTPIEPGHVYVARGGADMVLTERLGRVVALPKPENRQYLWHPSVSVLVDSAMRVLPPQRLVGVMLTGMGNDGAAEMARLKKSGGRTIAESKESAVVFGMPAELIECGGASLILPAQHVARQLRTWAG